jgi:hypothetical protein
VKCCRKEQWIFRFLAEEAVGVFLFVGLKKLRWCRDIAVRHIDLSFLLRDPFVMPFLGHSSDVHKGSQANHTFDRYRNLGNANSRTSSGGDLRAKIRMMSTGVNRRRVKKAVYELRFLSEES